MNSLSHHLGRVREQPHHIRRQIAFTIALGVTVLIAFVWLIGSIATGAFAIGKTSFADAGKDSGAAAAAAPAGSTNLIGAAGAALTGSATGPAHIEIINVDSGTQKTKAKPADPTVIPF